MLGGRLGDICKNHDSIKKYLKDMSNAMFVIDENYKQKAKDMELGLLKSHELRISYTGNLIDELGEYDYKLVMRIWKAFSKKGSAREFLLKCGFMLAVKNGEQIYDDSFIVPELRNLEELL